MRIKAVVLENFRAYRKMQRVPVAALTAFIGKNDAGKSTILEALDIFFDGGTVKIESSDANKGGNAKQVRVGVVFNELPSQIVLDSNAPTTFAGEYLINADGDLEVHKVFNCALATPKATLCARAIHPRSQSEAGILQKSQKDLKAIIKERVLQNNCNQAENPSMRHAIYMASSDLELGETDVPLNDDNGKAIWTALQGYFPMFALFQSDRPSTDQDPEVQNPMKLAVDRALDELGAELEAITDQVRKKAEETATRTLAKLQATYPNLASALQPKFRRPAWKSIFKMDLEADDGIPLNKRGSGVRRLVLLSFFQAEAEKRRADAAVNAAQHRRIVYAIEEPETSQHPDSQHQIIGALRDLADAGDQVLFTTHVPGLAGLIPLESLRYVDKGPQTADIRVRAGTPEVYAEIADALGVLPHPIRTTGVKVAVLVEGKNDIDALRSMAMVMAAGSEIDGWSEAQIFWTIGGGDHTLQDWIERRYLDKLGIPQIVIQDSDRSAAAVPLATNKALWLESMKALPHVTAFLTRKRCMDNYVHPGTINRLTGGGLSLPTEIDLDYVKISATMGPLLTAARAAGLAFYPDDHEGTPILGTSSDRCKRIIAAYFMRHMTVEEIRERATYTDEAGLPCHEVRQWIEAIRLHL